MGPRLRTCTAASRRPPGLRRSVVSTTGDFLYIPPDVPHQPVNLSDTEPALAVVARNTGEEQESVVAYDAGAETAAGANPDPEPRRDPDPGRDAPLRRS